MSVRLAIVGRPNVGKSTLFNRLVGKRLAIVDDQPGVTRDLREGAARLGALRFKVLDTAGLENAHDESLQGRMRDLTLRAVETADICLFMIDARVGVMPDDQQFAEILRKSGKEIILITNKAEGRAAEGGILEAYSLGLGEPIAFSAEHGQGLDELAHRLAPLIDGIEQDQEQDVAETDVEIDDADSDEDIDFEIDPEKPLRIAVLGRPNAGKSTLVNAILGEDKMLTGPEAGITRDAIASETNWFGQAYKIFDTAGVRKKAKVQEKLEKLSVADGLRAVKFAEIVVLVLDAEIPFETQDLRLADLAEREGRAVVVCVNKWDVIAEKGTRMAEIKEQFTRLLPQLRGAPIVFLSAKTGRGLERLHNAILDVYKVWNTRISTGALNRWLEGMISSHPPPAPSGRRIKIRYMTQVKTRPPSFIAMCSLPDELPASYNRFLVNGLRQSFELEGTPIRLTMRKGENPYKGKKKTRPTALSKHKHGRFRE